jgi:hypothetical protein
MGMVTGVVLFIGAMFVSRATIAAENLALRHQLGILQRSVKRPQLRQTDRIFWVWLSRLWPSWRDSLAIVKPETVIRWTATASSCINAGSRVAGLGVPRLTLRSAV